MSTRLPLAARDAPSAPAPDLRHGVSNRFRYDIEGLRAVAVVLVVAFHAKVPGFSGGFVGVDVFFVLSGYLITGILMRELEDTGCLDLVKFYARRARRLLPASALMLGTTLLVGTVILSPLEQMRLADTAMATAFYVSNLWFMRQASDYFATGAETNPLLHTWSLAVEEQFYFVWPILIVNVVRLSSSRRKQAAVIALLVAVSFAGSWWLTYLRQPYAFYFSPARAWEFGLGALAGFLPASLVLHHNAFRHALGFGGLLAILISGVLYSPETLFPGVAAMLPAIGTIAVLVAGASRAGDGVESLLAVPVMQRVGQLSYSWYLWHWPALVFALAISPELSLGGRIAVALGSLAVAAAAYRFIENPLRAHPLLVPRPAFSLILALTLTVGAIAFSAAASGAAALAADQPEQRMFVAASRDLPAVARNGCILSGASKGLGECVFGDTAASRTIVLFGDSHAAQWFPALEPLANEHGFRLVTLLRSSCPAARVTVYNRGLRRIYTECDEWRGAAIRRIAEIEPAGVVVASSGAYTRATAEYARPRATYADWEQGYRSVLTSLTRGGTPVALIRNSPIPVINVPACLSRSVTLIGRWKKSNCEIDRDEALDAKTFRMEQAAARGIRGATFIDLTAHLCKDDICEPVRDGIVVYRDTNHLTAAYAERLKPVLLHLIPFFAVP